jgi:CRISPR-associated protein Cas5t
MDRKDEAKGNKYNVTPVRREFLADVRAYVCLDFFENPEIEQLIRRALAGLAPTTKGRYGLPFMGDNAFLIDRIQVRDSPVEALWYRRLHADAVAGPASRTTRLTIWVDRLDLSMTKSALFAPDEHPTRDSGHPNWTAWTTIQPPSAPAPRAKARPMKV